MKKLTLIFIILNCFHAYGQDSLLSNKKNKFSINLNGGILFYPWGKTPYAAFGPAYFKYNLPYDFNLNYVRKGKKRWHEFGIAYIQKKGETDIKTATINCHSSTSITSISYKADFNYLAAHYGVEFPLKKDLLSITPFLRIGYSFNSNYEKVVEPFCYENFSDLSIYEKTPYFETGFGLNYKLISKERFNTKLRFRSSFRGINPEEDVFISLGLIFDFIIP